MIFNLNFPHTDGTERAVVLTASEVIFMLGANGAGKSSLMHNFFQKNAASARRITAHRQTWFTSNTVDMTANSKRNTEQNIHSSDQGHDARWKDDFSAARPGITLFDLFDAENVRARQIAQAVDRNDIQAAQQFSSIDAPLKRMNELMKQANLAIEIEVQSGEQITARKNGGDPFSIAQLSDGERNALLIAASVLTAKPNSLILVDEPERHLHRSIISPLLTQLESVRD